MIHFSLVIMFRTLLLLLVLMVGGCHASNFSNACYEAMEQAAGCFGQETHYDQTVGPASIFHSHPPDNATSEFIYKLCYGCMEQMNTVIYDLRVYRELADACDKTSQEKAEWFAKSLDEITAAGNRGLHARYANYNQTITVANLRNTRLQHQIDTQQIYSLVAILFLGCVLGFMCLKQNYRINKLRQLLNSQAILNDHLTLKLHELDPSVPIFLIKPRQDGPGFTSTSSTNQSIKDNKRVCEFHEPALPQEPEEEEAKKEQ
jgi:hypothetical protein